MQTVWLMQHTSVVCTAPGCSVAFDVSELCAAVRRKAVATQRRAVTARGGLSRGRGSNNTASVHGKMALLEMGHVCEAANVIESKV